jgi:hypothetical protein
MEFFQHWSTGILVVVVDCCLYCQCRLNPDQNSLAGPHFLVSFHGAVIVKNHRCCCLGGGSRCLCLNSISR